MFTADGQPDLSRGSLYVSVSNILAVQGGGDFLIRWALKEFGGKKNPIAFHSEFMEKVSSLGTRLHHFFELDLQGRKHEADKIVADDMLPGIESYLRWKKQHEIELVDSEKILFSKKLGVAGTRDLRVKIDGQLYVADFKTGSVQDKAFCQLAIYSYMGMELGEVENKGAKLLVIGGDKEKIANGGEVHMHEMSDWFGDGITQADLFSWFMCLRHVWMLQNLKSRKWIPVVKGMQEWMDPMIARFKAKFEEL